MKTSIRKTCISSAIVLALMFSSGAFAFNSGSTGADSAFNPTIDTELQLPPSGIFNFTSVNIPSGVTVTFRKNATNTPVVILVSGDFVLAGTINISGSSGAQTSNSDVNSGQPGVGGPGGYSGGRGGLIAGSTSSFGGNGLGPGAGQGGISGRDINNFTRFGGGGAGFASIGGTLTYQGDPAHHPSTGSGGSSYGSTFLLPLIGGSGGGGGSGGTALGGAGGGGGGGAILVAVSGTADIQTTGSIVANGGSGGNILGYNDIGGNTLSGGCGGGGSGGAIRIVATIVQGTGQLLANGSSTGANCVNTASNGPQSGGDGAPGIIRVEGEKMVYGNAADSPLPSYDTLVGPVFLPSQPGLRIASVAGIAAPAAPTGNMDVALPSSTTNPVTVQFSTNGIPLGTTITLTATPTYGDAVTAASTALAGTVDNGSATATIALPTGQSVLSATVSYTITASLGNELSRFAKGERVKKVELATNSRGESMVTLITVSGKRYRAPAGAVPAMSAG